MQGRALRTSWSLRNLRRGRQLLGWLTTRVRTRIPIRRMPPRAWQCWRLPKWPGIKLGMFRRQPIHRPEKNSSKWRRKNLELSRSTEFLAARSSSLLACSTRIPGSLTRCYINPIRRISLIRPSSLKLSATNPLPTPREYGASLQSTNRRLLSTPNVGPIRPGGRPEFHPLRWVSDDLDCSGRHGHIPRSCDHRGPDRPPSVRRTATETEPDHCLFGSVVWRLVLGYRRYRARNSQSGR